MAKLWASQAAMKVATDAVQVHGGYGYTTEYEIERDGSAAGTTALAARLGIVQTLAVCREFCFLAGEQEDKCCDDASWNRHRWNRNQRRAG